MMLGTEWGTEGDLEKLCKPTPDGRPQEEKESNPTWVRSRNLLREADANGKLQLESKVWFTNFAMGVRAGFGSNSKKISPWFKFKERCLSDYVRDCTKIFELQLKRQRPCAIVTFGKPVPITLARMYPSQVARWDKERFQDRDLNDGAAIENVIFGRYKVPLIVSIVHPSKWRANVWHRRFRGLEGDAAERALLKLVADQVRK